MNDRDMSSREIGMPRAGGHDAQQESRAHRHPWKAAAKCAACLAILMLLLTIAVTGDAIVTPAHVASVAPAELPLDPLPAGEDESMKRQRCTSSNSL